MPFNVCFSKLCSKSKANKDYAAIPYEQSKKLPSPVRVQVEQNRAKPDHLNKLKKCTAKRNLFNDCVEYKAPDFQSTILEQSSVNFATEFNRFESPKITSTMIQQNTIASFDSVQTSPSLTCISEESTYSSSAFSNTTYSSPASKRTNTSIFTNDSSDFEQTQYYTNPSCASDAFQDVNPSFFDNYARTDMIYVCIESYEPHFQGDIGLQYSERVNIIHATEEFSLVKKISSQECGYVPSSCLTSFSSFITNVC